MIEKMVGVSLGIDEGFGSSKTAFTIIEYLDRIVHCHLFKTV